MDETLNARLDALQPELIKSIQTLVGIRSVENKGEGGTPYGKGTKQCLDKALALCKGFGFKTFNMDDHLGWAEWGEGDEMVAILGHLDVVPEGDGWTVCGPFDGLVKDGRLYGRGTIDDKGPTLAAVYALKALKDTGFIPKKRVRILFGCNEETGSADMEYYNAHGGEAPVMGFTPDGEYPLINGEKGIITTTYEKKLAQRGEWKLLSIRGGAAFNIAPAHAEAEIECPEDVSVLAQLSYPEKIHVTATETGLHIEAEGIAAHGSIPERGENAIGRLCLFLKQLPLSPDAAAAVAFLADSIGMDTTGSAFGIDLKDDISGALSFNLGIIESDGDKELPARRAGEEPQRTGARTLRVRINYRFPVTYKIADCAPKLNAAFEKAGWAIVQEDAREALYIPADSALVQALLGVYREATGDSSAPKCIGGGTYAKSIPNILAFGPVFPGDEAREHQPDEYIDLARLALNTKILAEAIRALAG